MDAWKRRRVEHGKPRGGMVRQVVVLRTDDHLQNQQACRYATD